MVRHFSLDRISRTAAIFDMKKLQWMNGFYIRQLNPARLAERALPYFEKQLPPEVKRPLDVGYVSQVVALQRERAKTLCEFPQNSTYFFVEDIEYPVDLFLKGGISRERAVELLDASGFRLERLEPFDTVDLERALRSLSEELPVKTGDLFGILRVAVTGRTAAPPLFQTMVVVGREKCVRRIKSAIQKLSEVHAS